VLAPGPATRALFGVSGLILLVGVLARNGGRWWLSTVDRHRALSRRRREAHEAVGRVAGSGDTRLVSMVSVAPSAAVRAYRDRDTSIGIGQDDNGWYCALEVAPRTSLSGERDVQFGLDRLARIFAETAVPVSAVQMVTQVVPAPSGHVDAGAPLSHSYRELLGADSVQAEQQVFLAARLTPRDAAEAAATRGGGLSGVDKAMATTIARVAKALSESDIPYRVLDAEELLDAVSSSVGATDGRFDERWRGWYGAGLAQVCLEVDEWPRTPAVDFLIGLTRVGAALVSVSVELSPLGDEVGLRGLVRVGADSARINQAVREVSDAARRVGARLHRLDGAHGPGVYATSPTGGAL
jgi:type VII secretion protein EccE